MLSAAAFRALLTSVSVCCGAALADELATSTSSVAPKTAVAARDQLYADLAADVAELEQRGSILKRVVKLVTPAVVHIEAKRDTEASRPARGEAEEAGSG